ncbi:MAG: hypothetical protein P8Y69_12205, partial [Gammaproteobacteria bacterium]
MYNLVAIQTEAVLADGDTGELVENAIQKLELLVGVTGYGQAKSGSGGIDAVGQAGEQRRIGVGVERVADQTLINLGQNRIPGRGETAGHPKREELIRSRHAELHVSIEPELTAGLVHRKEGADLVRRQERELLRQEWIGLWQVHAGCDGRWQ